MRILAEYEYILVVNSRHHGTRLCYKLRENKPINQVNISGIIPTAEELKEKMSESVKPGKSG